jgi:hypothetical protein
VKAPPPSSSASPLCKGKDDDGGSDDDEDVHGDEDEDDDAFEDDMSESEDDDDDHEVDEESDDGGEKLSKKQKKAPPAKCGKCGFVNANCACAAPLRYEYLEAEIDKTGPIGMTLGMKAGSAAVVDIKQNSAAAGTGIRIGDQVEGLNGTMVIGWELAKIVEVLGALTGWIKIRLKRGVGYAAPAAGTKLPKKKKKKAKKDPNAPKKPKTAYIYFCNVKRPEVVASNPIGVSHGDLMKLVGTAWKELSAEEKTQFEELSAKDKERYATEMQAYIPPVEEIDSSGNVSDGSSASAKKRKREKKKKAKDPNAPKKALSAYMIFGAAKRIELKGAQPDLDFKEVAIETGKQWRELSEENKVQWNEKSAVLKAKYLEEMEDYAPPPADLTSTEDLDGGKASKKKKKRKKKDPSARESIQLPSLLTPSHNICPPQPSVIAPLSCSS